MSAPSNYNNSFKVFSPSAKLLAAKEHTNQHIPRVPGKPTLLSKPLPNLGKKAIQLLRLSHDVLLVQSFLLCGLATNPGPAKLMCFSYQKTIRKNQGRTTCTSCQLLHHLKCLGSETFENNQTCVLCSVRGVPEVDKAQHQQDSQSPIHSAEHYQLPQKLMDPTRGLKIVHLNIRRLRGKSNNWGYWYRIAVVYASSLWMKPG